MGNRFTQIYLAPPAPPSSEETYELISNEQTTELPPSQEHLVVLMNRNKLLAEARDYVVKQNYAQAECTYKKIIEQYPKDYLPLTLYGDLLVRLKRYSDAHQVYKSALTLNPLSAETWIRKAQCLVMLKEFESAATAYENAMLSNCHGFVNHYVMALLQLSRRDEALYILDRIAQLKPKDAYYYAFRGTILIEQGNLPDALIQLNASMQFKQVPALTYISLSLHHLMCQNYKEALFYVELSLSMTKQNEYLYAYEAMAYLGLCDLENAETYIIKALSNPKNHLGLLAKAKLLYMKEEYDEASLIIEGLSSQKIGTNRYYSQQLSSMISELRDRTSKKKEETSSIPPSQLIGIRQTVYNISIRHGQYEEEEEEDANHLKSKIKILKEILQVRLAEAKQDKVNLKKLSDTLDK